MWRFDILTFVIGPDGLKMSAPELEDPMKVDGIGHYERLGITQQADNKEIKKAYRNKAKELHPDKNKDDPDAGVCIPISPCQQLCANTYFPVPTLPT